MDWNNSKQGLQCWFSVRKGALKRGLTLVFDCLMARDIEDRTDDFWRCITDQEATDLLEHRKFQTHIKMKIFYDKDNWNRNPEGLWNLHHVRYSKLI